MVDQPAAAFSSAGRISLRVPFPQAEKHPFVRYLTAAAPIEPRSEGAILVTGLRRGPFRLRTRLAPRAVSARRKNIPSFAADAPVTETRPFSDSGRISLRGPFPQAGKTSLRSLPDAWRDCPTDASIAQGNK